MAIVAQTGVIVAENLKAEGVWGKAEIVYELLEENHVLSEGNYFRLERGYGIVEGGILRSMVVFVNLYATNLPKAGRCTNGGTRMLYLVTWISNPEQ